MFVLKLWSSISSISNNWGEASAYSVESNKKNTLVKMWSTKWQSYAKWKHARAVQRLSELLAGLWHFCLALLWDFLPILHTLLRALDTLLRTLDTDILDNKTKITNFTFFGESSNHAEIILVNEQTFENFLWGIIKPTRKINFLLFRLYWFIHASGTVEFTSICV